MNRSQKFLGITLMASLLCGFTPMQSEAKEYKIGGMYTYDYHDGRHADWGEYELHAAKMAIEDINACLLYTSSSTTLSTAFSSAGYRRLAHWRWPGSASPSPSS